MSSYLSERIAVVATVNPSALLDNTNVTTNYVDISKFDKVMFVVSTSANDTTIDVDVLEDVAGDGGDTAVLKSTTQSTEASGHHVIEVSNRELTNGKRYIACKATVGNGSSGSYVSILGLAGDARVNPASDNDLASVHQIVT